MIIFYNQPLKSMMNFNVSWSDLVNYCYCNSKLFTVNEWVFIFYMLKVLQFLILLSRGEFCQRLHLRKTHTYLQQWR